MIFVLPVLRLAQRLRHGSLQAQHGREDCVWERGQTSLLALAGLSAGKSVLVDHYFREQGAHKLGKVLAAAQEARVRSKGCMFDLSDECN